MASVLECPGILNFTCCYVNFAETNKTFQTYFTASTRNPTRANQAFLELAHTLLITENISNVRLYVPRITILELIFHELKLKW